MKRALTPYHLGGSLYIPADHKNLRAVCTEDKYPHVRSVIIDFEDALDESSYEKAFEAFSKLLSTLVPQDLLIFVRTKTHHDLARFLALDNIESIDGFVLAKCDTQSMEAYFEELKSKPFWVMPVLESPELFEAKKREQIRSFFLQHKEMILSLRFGGEDLSSHIGLKRQKHETWYDFTLLSHMLDTIVLDFAPFSITAPVYTYYRDEENFMKEATEDLRHGLFGKTVIHPDQAKLLETIYKVPKEFYESAIKVTDKDAPAIMSHDGGMLETIPHRRWAKAILERETLYGHA